MITDLEIARLCDAIYGRGEDPGWDHLDKGDDDGVFWGLKKQGGYDVVVFRGSVDLEDFAIDGEAAFWVDGDLGPVHMGFLQGMHRVLSEVAGQLSGPWICTGHSLGAARALLLAGLAIVAKIPPSAAIVFGEPRPGFKRLADVLAPLTIRSYRNADERGHDQITDVPYHIEPLWPYVHPRPLIDVSEAPSEDDDSPFRYHHMPLYVGAVAKLNPMPTLP